MSLLPFDQSRTVPTLKAWALIAFMPSLTLFAILVVYFDPQVDGILMMVLFILGYFLVVGILIFNQKQKQKRGSERLNLDKEEN